MNHVIRHICNPNFRFPSKCLRKLLKCLKIQKSCNIDFPGSYAGGHFFNLFNSFRLPKLTSFQTNHDTLVQLYASKRARRKMPVKINGEDFTFLCHPPGHGGAGERQPDGGQPLCAAAEQGHRFHERLCEQPVLMGKIIGQIQDEPQQLLPDPPYIDKIPLPLILEKALVADCIPDFHQIGFQTEVQAVNVACVGEFAVSAAQRVFPGIGPILSGSRGAELAESVRKGQILQGSGIVVAPK